MFSGGVLRGRVAPQDVVVEDLYDQLERAQLRRSADHLSLAIERVRAVTVQPDFGGTLEAVAALDRAWVEYRGPRDRLQANR